MRNATALGHEAPSAMLQWRIASIAVVLAVDTMKT
jgi:hypothetical protein